MMQVAFLCFFAISMSSIVSSTTNISSCPLDLNYVQTIPWNTSVCQTSLPKTTTIITPTQHCCQALLSLFGIGLALHLKQTSLFQLPDLPTASACIINFQDKLSSLSLPPDIAPTCFGSPERFHTGPQICAGIETKQDWINKLGSSTQIDSSCKSDLSDPSSCDACVKAGFKVQAKLTSIDGNVSHSTDCFYFTILYAGGIVNEYGPENITTASCIFGLPISTKLSSKGKENTSLVFILIGVGVVVVVLIISCVLIWFFVWDKRRKGLGEKELEESNLKLHLRPNTGSIWFKLEELERATDNFSERNLIGRGGFGVVYKGTLSDGTLVAVKKMIESDFEGKSEFCNEVEIISNLRHRNLVPLRGCCVSDGDDDKEFGKQRYLVYDYMPNGNLKDHLFSSEISSTDPQAILITDWAWMLVKSGQMEKVLDASLLKDEDPNNPNPKMIMERFVLVGILCAHVMVALRPTIPDALKMLEGDVEVPSIPDRPLPLGHQSFCSSENTFSIPPYLSEPQGNSGDLLR
ncbi:Kinase protein [Thalictrum thalictroides]|uniref:Kinase protein n=1 Tax=Thalictrum thalictroides TaxID=46969 RepID=A0A7J6WD90_THATH|nr:Kinase protein [Thalictrum thalictroides]